MPEPVIIQQQRAILRALRQANTQHAQVITATDAKWQKVLRAYDEVRARLAQVGEEKLLQSAVATPSVAPSSTNPAEAFHQRAEKVLQVVQSLWALFQSTPTIWQLASKWRAHDSPGFWTTKVIESPHVSVSFSPDGRLLASGGTDDNKVKVWELMSGRLLHTITGHDKQVNSVAFSPDSRLLASAGSDAIKVWDVVNGQMFHTFNLTSWSVTFSPDGRLLASGSKDLGNKDWTVKVWEVTSGRLLHTLSEHKYSVISVAFSPDGRLLASGGWDETVKVWEVESGRLLHTLRGHTLNVESVAFSPDGRLLASGSYDKTVKIWDVASGRLLNNLRGHTDWVSSVAFSRDGRMVISGSKDKTVKIWEIASGKILQTLGGHTGRVGSIAFSPNGQLLAVGSGSTDVVLWKGEWPELPKHVATLAQAKAEAEFWYARYQEQAMAEYQHTLQGQVLAAYQQWQEQFSQSGHPAAFPWQDPAWQEWQPAGSTMGVVRLGAFKA